MTVTASFLPGIAEKLSYYVYALIDPREAGQIFYVGKGKGNRAYQHATEATAFAPEESPDELKIAKIHEIHAAHKEVRVEVIRHNLTEQAAYEVEAGAIDVLRLAGIDLTNRARGKGSRAIGWMPLEELRATYAAPHVQIAGEHRVMLVRINQLYRAGMTDQELYEATRQWWRVRPARGADWAFAVVRGVVRAVYRIDKKSWERDADSARWRFTAVRDAEMEKQYVWRNVAEYFTSGAQYPIRYKNC